MLNVIRNQDSTIHLPIDIDPDETYDITLKNKLSCAETVIQKQGEMCGTLALFILNTDLCLGEYWLTIGEYKTTLRIQ